MVLDKPVVEMKTVVGIDPGPTTFVFYIMTSF
jgi:hypothetical protein